MNANSKASIGFEAFFFVGEDCNNDDIISFNKMVTYSRKVQTTTGREWTPDNSFDMGLIENVAESSINFELALAGGQTDGERRSKL